MHRKNILIVSATTMEIEGLIPVQAVNDVSMGHIFPINHNRHTITLLVTGPGMIPTAFYLGKILGVKYYDLVINTGIAGSFLKEFPVGTVVNVVSDCFAELGAEHGGNFIPFYKMGMSKPYMPTFVSEKGIINNIGYPAPPVIKKIPVASGITVNTISGEAGHIELIRSRTDADIETMEGAAFFYACMMSAIPCLQIRAISNYIEPRNADKWDIPTAVRNLNQTLIKILDEI
jgi:futalosine hydrolase